MPKSENSRIFVTTTMPSHESYNDIGKLEQKDVLRLFQEPDVCHAMDWRKFCSRFGKELHNENIS